MNISTMNKKIKIQALSTIQNDNGFDEETWIDFKKIWCAINNLNGREFWVAKAVQSETTVIFTIRYANFVNSLDTKKYRILVDDSKIYNITFINNINNQNKFVEIKALLEEI